MSCVIYREGKGHVINGQECEVTNCEPEDLQNHLDNGWSTEPPGAYEQPQLAPKSPDVYQQPDVEPNVTDEPEPVLADADYEERDVPVVESEYDAEEEESEPNDGALDSVEVVRQKAKDAGLAGWDTKRVKTLRRELEKL